MRFAVWPDVLLPSIDRKPRLFLRLKDLVRYQVETIEIQTDALPDLVSPF